MTDLARDRGVEIDVEALSERLGVPVVAVQANRRVGLDQLKTALASAATRELHGYENPLPELFQQTARELGDRVEYRAHEAVAQFSGRTLALGRRRLSGGRADEWLGPKRQRRRAACRPPSRWPRPACRFRPSRPWPATTGSPARSTASSRRPTDHSPTTSDRIDAVLTHKIFGTLIFVAVMALLFSSIFVLADPLMRLVDGGVGWLGDLVGCEHARRRAAVALVDGVIGGVGAVVVFLPQILILFFFIALLEDCGYMARAAFLMDRVMAGVGLSGKSFIPLLSSFALRDSRHHGHASDRESPRPVCHDSDRAADELLGPLAGVRDLDRGVCAGAEVPGRSGRPARVDAAGHVFDRRDRGDRRGLAAEAHACCAARRHPLCWNCRATSGRRWRRLCIA